MSAGQVNPRPGDTLQLGVPSGIEDPALVFAGGPAGTDKNGPSPQEVADGWVFKIMPTTWPNNQKQWADLGWGTIGPGGSVGGFIGTLSRVAIWYRWINATIPTAAPPPPPPPPDALPVLSSADATWGKVIPQSAGTRRINGVPIWLGSVHRIADHGTVGAVSFAMAFGTTARPADEPRLTQLTRLWADGVLVYDGLSTTSPVLAGGMSITFYPGLVDAQPDPTIKAAMGATTPAFRDLYYVVIHNFPLAAGTSKVPTIRAELVDSPAFAVPALTAFVPLDPPTQLEPFGMVADFDSNTFFGLSHTTSLPHVLHTYDMTTGTEISSVPIDDSIFDGQTIVPPNQFDYMAVDFWNVYDPHNFLMHSQSGSALSNSMRIESIRTDSGVIIASYGNESNSLASADNSQVFSEHADFVRFRAWGEVIHALLLGTISHEVAVVSYRRQVTQASASNAVQTDRCGLLAAGDAFHLGFETAYDAGGSVLSVCAYPVLDRPELEAAFKLSTLDGQDAVLLYGMGTQLFCVSGGLVSSGGGSASWATTNAQRAIFDFSPLTPNNVFVDPTTGCIMALALDGSGDGFLYKLKPEFLLGTNGAALNTVSVEYKTAINGVNTFPQEATLRTSRLSGGTFAYFSGADVVVVSLATGNEVYRQTQPTTASDRIIYDSVTQQIILPVGTGSPALPTKESILSGSSTLIPVTDFLTWCGRKLTYAVGDISNDGNTPDTLIGVNIDTPTTARSAMSAVAAMYGVSSVEFAGTLRFVRPQQGDAAQVTAVFSNEDLSRAQEGQMDSVSETVLSADEIPSDIEVDYLDPANDYNGNAQIYRRVRFPFATAKTQTATQYGAPIVITSSQALAIAGRLVLTAFGQGSTYEYRLPHRFINVLPGDVIGFLGDDRLTITELSQVQQISYNGDWSLTVKGVRWSLSDTLVLTSDIPPGRISQDLQGPSDSVALAFDIPYIDPTADIVPGAANIYTGVGSLGQAWWTAAQVSRTLDSTTTPLYLADITIPYGTVVQALPACEGLGETFKTDHDTVLDVSARTFNANLLASVSAEDCRAGKNQVLIGAPGRWELVYFQTVEVVSPNHFRLSDLLRGRRGTNINCDNHAAGDQIVLVKSQGAKTNFRGDHIDIKYRGKQLSYYAVGANTLRPAVADTFNFLGASELPWTVRRIRAKFAGEVNAVGTTSYLNECGTGDRRELIKVLGVYHTAVGSLGPDGGSAPYLEAVDYSPSNLVDGDATSNAQHATNVFDGQTAISIMFDFHASGFKQCIDEFTWTQNNPTSIGTFEWEASDDAVSWSSLASGLTNINGIHAYSNATGYWFYRLRQTGGTTSSSPWLKEMEFKCKAVPDDANDILISWLRRDRLKPADLFVTDTVPMSEAAELYSVDVSLVGASNPAASFKTLPLTTGNRAVYSAASQTADGFTPPLSTLTVRVAQVGAGDSNNLGFTAAKTVEVT